MVFLLEFVSAFFGGGASIDEGEHKLPFKINIPFCIAWAHTCADYARAGDMGLRDWLHFTAG